MIGSMFYSGDKIVSSHAEGLFDKEEAENQLGIAEEMSDKTGLPIMVDLVSENAIAASRYIDFIVESTDMPIVLDVVAENEQIKALHYVDEIGVIDRVILNSLTPHSGDQLYKAIDELKLRSSILFNS